MDGFAGDASHQPRSHRQPERERAEEQAEHRGKARSAIEQAAAECDAHEDTDGEGDRLAHSHHVHSPGMVWITCTPWVWLLTVLVLATVVGHLLVFNDSRDL